MGAPLLFALALFANGQRSPLTIDGSTGTISMGGDTYDASPETYCNAAFRHSPEPSFSIQAGLQLLTLSTAGALLANVSLPPPLDNWSGLIGGEALVGNSLLALGYPATPTGAPTVWEVDPRLGIARVLATGFPVYNGLLSCLFAAGQSGAASAYWASDAPDLSTRLSTLELGSGKVTSVLYDGDGALSGIAAYTPQGSSAEHLLVLDIKGGRGPVLVDVDPASGTVDNLLELGQDLESDAEGLAWHAATSTAFTVMCRIPSPVNGTCLEHLLISFNLTASPPTVHKVTLALPSNVTGVVGVNA